MPRSRARMLPKTCVCGKVCANALHLAKHHKRDCPYIAHATLGNSTVEAPRVEMAKRLGLPGAAWLDVVDSHASRAIVGHVAPVIGMTNGNIVIVRVEHDRYLTRRREHPKERARSHRSGMVIDASEAARFGWTGDVRLRRTIANAPTAAMMAEFGDGRFVIDGDGARYILGNAGRYIVRSEPSPCSVPLYSVDGADPVCIEAAALAAGVR